MGRPPAHPQALIGSRIFRVCVRPAAVIFTQLQCYWTSYPARIFLLLHRPSQADEALRLLQQPTCVLDEWSLQFRRRYPTLLSLMSRECKEVLSTMALQVVTTAWSTERLHSRHARRSRSRRHTHEMHLRSLGCMHAADSRADWWHCLDALVAKMQKPEQSCEDGSLARRRLRLCLPEKLLLV